MAVSAHFSCLRSLSGTIEVTVVFVVVGLSWGGMESTVGSVFREYAFSPWLCYWVIDAVQRLSA